MAGDFTRPESLDEALQGVGSVSSSSGPLRRTPSVRSSSVSRRTRSVSCSSPRHTGNRTRSASSRTLWRASRRSRAPDRGRRTLMTIIRNGRSDFRGQPEGQVVGATLRNAAVRLSSLGVRKSGVVSTGGGLLGHGRKFPGRDRRAEVGPNVGPIAPEHQGKPASTRYQKTRPANKI